MFHSEQDRYVGDFRELGFEPECHEGGTPPGPGWIVGCDAAFRVELRGQGVSSEYTATAQALSGPKKGTRWSVSSDGASPGEVVELLRH
jgi:hypothetical protein